VLKLFASLLGFDSVREGICERGLEDGPSSETGSILVGIVIVLGPQPSGTMLHEGKGDEDLILIILDARASQVDVYLPEPIRELRGVPLELVRSFDPNPGVLVDIHGGRGGVGGVGGRSQIFERGEETSKGV